MYRNLPRRRTQDLLSCIRMHHAVRCPRAVRSCSCRRPLHPSRCLSLPHHPLAWDALLVDKFMTEGRDWKVRCGHGWICGIAWPWTCSSDVHYCTSALHDEALQIIVDFPIHCPHASKLGCRGFLSVPGFWPGPSE